jgi:hypothetical protein
MAETYKEKIEKLKNFIAEIPMHPNQIVSGGPNKPPYDEDFKKRLQDPNFSLPTNKLFLKYTGTSHTTLVKSWASGGKLTTCNGFVGVCGKEMGANDFLGQFELEEFLKKIGKGHAWIPADRGKQPGYGDIFRSIGGMHLGLSLGVKDEIWTTAEAGQGGPSSGFDAVKRLQRKFEPGILRGWCDIRLYFDPRPAIPDWLIGWWTIYCGNVTYKYRFTEYSEAFYYPSTLVGDPQNATPIDTGSVLYQGFDSFTVSWGTEGGTESFKYDRFESCPGLNEMMTGTSCRGEQLKGVRH